MIAMLVSHDSYNKISRDYASRATIDVNSIASLILSSILRKAAVGKTASDIPLLLSVRAPIKKTRDLEISSIAYDYIAFSFALRLKVEAICCKA